MMNKYFEIVNEIMNRVIYILVNVVSLIIYGFCGDRISNKFDNKINKIINRIIEIESKA